MRKPGFFALRRDKRIPNRWRLAPRTLSPSKTLLRTGCTVFPSFCTNARTRPQWRRTGGRCMVPEISCRYLHLHRSLFGEVRVLPYPEKCRFEGNNASRSYSGRAFSMSVRDFFGYNIPPVLQPVRSGSPCEAAARAKRQPVRSGSPCGGDTVNGKVTCADAYTRREPGGAGQVGSATARASMTNSSRTRPLGR